MQNLLDEMYGERDRRRGKEKTMLWLVEEVGELAEEVNRGRDHARLEEEAADVLAWLLSLMNVVGVDLEKAFLRKYGKGCPRCGHMPCECPEE